MSNIELYTKAHSLKRISRQIQHLSYTLNKLEIKYPIDTLSDPELEVIIAEYESIFNELKDLNAKINTNVNTNTNENQDNTHKILG